MQMAVGDRRSEPYTNQPFAIFYCLTPEHIARIDGSASTFCVFASGALQLCY